MPRVSLRRTVIYLTVIGVLSLYLLNLAYRGLDYTGVVKYDVGDGLQQQQRNLVAGDPGAPAPDPLDDPPATVNIPRADSDQAYLTDFDLANIPRLWFMKDGWARPGPAKVDRMTNQRTAHLFPEEDSDDRIVQQLMFVPPDYPEVRGNGTKLKKILLYNGINNWKPLRVGRHSFLADKCPVDTCEVTTDREDADTADAILFRDHIGQSQVELSRPSWQVWILYLLECPYHTQSFPYKNVFNWTATYRHGSDIVAPYEKFVPYDKDGRIRKAPPRNYAANKKKKVAWFVSNCGAQNGRMEYANQLAKYITVDIYGACGKHQCPRTNTDKCFDLLNKDYKFYLSFENSNCKDYITEKFFVNGLGNDVIPIVMGARKEDYKRASPPHSYIHVEDFASPKELADYLHLLDRNDTLYNEYFRWKGTGEFVNTYFWCRVCALLHDKHPSKVYEDANTWWRGSGTCINSRWDGKTD